MAENIGAERAQKRLIKYKRGGQVLSQDEVDRIKKGRKERRKQMRASGIKSKKEFEYVAASLGLYFDKTRLFALFIFLPGKLLWLLLGLAGALLLAMLIASGITELRGHFTINLTDDLFKAGFMLCDEPGFEDPSSRLYSQLVVDAPCISIIEIPEDVDKIDGSHNGDDYFAYTFYVKYVGDAPASYNYQLCLNSESQSLSVATWVMLFEDGEMTFFAKSSSGGGAEAIPAFDDDTRGYTKVPFLAVSKDPGQYQLIVQRGDVAFYRLIPESFVSDIVICEGTESDVLPDTVHKYTVVIWIEGDDPDCVNDLIGGHVGMEMNFKLIED